MFERLLDALESLATSIADAVNRFIDTAIDVWLWYLEWVMNGLMDAVANVGIPRHTQISLECGGHVQINYYVRRSG